MTSAKVVLVALVLALAPMPAHANAVECGGFAPLDVRCRTTFVPATPNISIALTTDATFVGEIEITLTRGSTSITHPCVQASIATECVGTLSNVFQAGQSIVVRAEVLTLNRVLGPLPVEDLTPSIGAWTVTVAG